MSSHALTVHDLDDLTPERLHSAAMWRYWNDAEFKARVRLVQQLVPMLGREYPVVIQALALDDVVRERFRLS